MNLGRRGRMGRSLAAILIALAVGCVGCAGSDGASSSSSSARGPSPAPPPVPPLVPSGSQTPARQAPAPPAADARLPADPLRLADALTQTTTELHRAVDGWRDHDAAARGRPPAAVVLYALHQQRIYRLLARRPDLARRTIARLPGRLAAAARDNVTASRDLFSLTRPVRSAKRFRTQDPRPAGTLLGYFKRAERRFEVDWQVLAAVMLVETKFGRIRSPSSAGAQGPMQFLPTTWDAYGLGGDIHDPRDAVLAAANYLHASGAPRDYARALYAYNPSRLYVEAVQRHARQIRRDPRNYYVYYNWQVFVLTTRGDVRLTGPEPRR